MTEVVVDDPGPGQRLGTASRSRLRAELRKIGRDGGTCALLSVRADAWHHAPEVASYDADQLAQPVVLEEFQSLVGQLFGLGVPVVAELDGAVSGLGLALAMAADLRVATPRTTLSLGDASTAAALLGGSTWLLTRAVGYATVAHLAWTGEALTSAVAEQRGLLSRVCDDRSAARRLAESLAAVPTPAASALKRALTSRQRRDLEASLDYESWLAGVTATAGDPRR
ncbi:enoyl-CoA hydratase/isomerase family protein [Pseudonocardia nigra]|uniref:enoyl-CoA hydratase/isomerase family protein n=1 Tax=Pseudonocardia nigra TaxID=1921578 RepID=UPI001C5E2FD6|nr:enoyl-CoA hydratase-related protein [Pseudonocardia nigra]